jgi:hypothetical protein
VTVRHLRVTRRIFVPGPTRHSRVLLAVPGRDYPADFVRAITCGDDTLVATDEAPTSSAPAPEPVEPDDDVDVVVADEDDDQFDLDVVDLEGFTKAELVDLAAERGVAVPGNATKAMLIGALTDHPGEN